MCSDASPRTSAAHPRSTHRSSRCRGRSGSTAASCSPRARSTTATSRSRSLAPRGSASRSLSRLMDFDFTDDQLALRDGARDLLDDHASPARVRAHTAAGAAYAAALWNAMSEQGWLAIELPEADGGVGLGAVEVAILAEQLGAHAAPAPFVPEVLALDALRAGGADEWVARILAGDAIACVAWDPDAPVTYAPSADVA